MKSVVVCVATFGRPALLRDCLLSIFESVVGVSGYRTTVLVVDNNAEDISDSIVTSLPSSDSVEWAVCHEPQPGIPFARNRALIESIARRADFIGFIDDDEVVDRRWFEEIMLAVDRPGVDVVSGAVFFKTDPLTSKYSSRPTCRDRAETDNVMFKSWIADRLRFDTAFAFCGGSDNLFFRQAFELGARIVSCDTAIAVESVPIERQSMAWRIRRQWRYGIVSTMIEKKLQHGRSVSLMAVVGMLQVPIGLLQFLVGTLRGRETALRGVDRLVRGVGTLAGLVGVRYDEYKRG